MANFFTELREGLIISFRAIRANKMRSVLTSLGIIIGVVSVTLMATAIEGVNRAFQKSAEAFGTDVLYIQKFPWVSNDDWSTIRNRRMLEVSYAARVERQSMFAAAVAPVVGTGISPSTSRSNPGDCTRIAGSACSSPACRCSSAASAS
jgi:putative ABC transport system permease protein